MSCAGLGWGPDILITATDPTNFYIVFHTAASTEGNANFRPQSLKGFKITLFLVRRAPVGRYQIALGQLEWRNLSFHHYPPTRLANQVRLILFTIYHAFGRIFLNPEEVENCFVEDLIGAMTTGEKYQQLAYYLMENLLESGALFPSKIWASLSSSLQQAKNACKCFHSHFSNCSYRPNPDICVYIIKSRYDLRKKHDFWYKN